MKNTLKARIGAQFAVLFQFQIKVPLSAALAVLGIVYGRFRVPFDLELESNQTKPTTCRQ